MQSSHSHYFNGVGGEGAGGMQSIQPTAEFKMECTEMSRKCLVWFTFMQSVHNTEVHKLWALYHLCDQIKYSGENIFGTIAAVFALAHKNVQQFTFTNQKSSDNSVFDSRIVSP